MNLPNPLSENYLQTLEPSSGDKETSPVARHLTDEDIFHYTDTGNAKRLTALFGSKIKFVNEWRKWFIWNGKFWKEDKENSIRELAKKTILVLYQEAITLSKDSDRQKAVKFALRSESSQNIRNMVALTESDLEVSATAGQFDSEKTHFLLNCQNGTIDLRTEKLKDHDPNDFITKIIPCDYDPKAKAPRFEQFISEIFSGDQVMICYVCKFLGYSLTGSTIERLLFFLYGLGKNGKTKLMNLLMRLLGPYSTKAAGNLLIEKRNDDHPTALADLRGSRVVVCNETAANRKLAESLVKDLTGTDKSLKARFMRQDFFSFDPIFKIFLYGNHKPVIKGRDQAIWDRIKLIPFNVRFDGDLEDKNLEEKLMAELPGFLAWCVRGCLLWQQEGLNPVPKSVSAATDDYKQEMDEIGGFVDEWICAISGNTPCKDVYKKYAEWATAEGQFCLKSRMFNAALEEAGFEKKPLHGNVLHWMGIGFRQ